MIQAQIQRCRVALAAAGAPTQPAVGVDPSAPQIVLSPRTPTDLLTTGFMFFGRNAGGDNLPIGTSLTVWKQDPVSGYWAVLLVVTPPQLAAFTWITVCDVNACPLYFQSDAQGAAEIFLEEIGFGGL